MLTKIIDPKSGNVVRTVEDSADLEKCLLALQDSDDPMVVQIGDGDSMLHVIPC